MRFPKLLVATEFPPNASGGGPAVIRQMLRDWPVDRLAWWSCLPERDERFGQRCSTHRVAAIPPRLYPSRRWTRPRSWLMERLWVPRATRHLQRVLAEVRPEAVWVIPHLWAIPPLARALPAGPFRFHTTVQDFVDTQANCARLGRHRAARMARSTESLYAAAATRDATSHPMVIELRQSAGQAAAQVLHAGLEAADFDYLLTKDWSAPRELRIAHAGTVVVEPDFILFLKALAEVRARLPVPIWLDFFGAHSYRGRQWFDPAWMREHGNLAEPALSHALRGCAWGLAMMSVSDADPRYNRFSFPTKFITCLAAGLPVITYAHQQSSLARMATSYRVGFNFSSTNPQTLAEELWTAFAPAQPAARFKEEIVRCARIEFDAERMRKVLYDCWMPRPGGT